MEKVDKRSSFQFNGKEYLYFDHPYNKTRTNERRVELPLAFDFIECHKSVIEIGNVTHHYRRNYTHDVVDKFEKVDWWPIINDDVLSWNPNKKYDGALSISTLEHTSNPVKAVTRMLGFAQNIFITIPVGFYRGDDVFDAFPNLQMRFMRRIDKDNNWEECSKKVAKINTYKNKFQHANAIIIIQSQLKNKEIKENNLTK